MFAIILFQMSLAYMVGLFYGPVSVILSPIKTWFCIWTAYVIYSRRNGIFGISKYDSESLASEIDLDRKSGNYFENSGKDQIGKNE